MSLELKNKNLLKHISLTAVSLIIIVLLFFFVRGSVWTEYDYQILDIVYRQIIKTGYGPKHSDFPQIKYVTINDETYSHIGKNFIDRSYLAKLNNALVDLGPQAIVYDIIFPHPTTPESDSTFVQSLKNTDSIYLPIGMNLSDKREEFKWGNGIAYKRLKNVYLKLPHEKGQPDPLYGTRALFQLDEFSETVLKSGHISAQSDGDGIFRHMLMLIKVNDKYLPTLSLSVFLDYIGVPFEKIIVEWGKHITIPALNDRFLEDDVVIPIDKKGRAFIPFCQTWKNDFEEMPSHLVLEKTKDINLRGNLSEIFEGNFVFIGDISVGVSDLGNTPIQNDIPLIVMHTSMLNSMLTNTFYKKWSYSDVILLILFLGLFVGISSFYKGSWLLYLSGVTLVFGIVFLTWLQFVRFSLFPIVTVLSSLVFIVSGLIISVELATSKDRAFLKNLFSRYVPEKIVARLLVNPEMIKLGGETRELSMIMSDIRGFTALSSSRSPQEVICILNQYFEKMIDIIMDHYGIVDEIVGDGILALFGAPEKMKNHPEKAIACAIEMQNAMEQINKKNKRNGLPELQMGIGVNTGEAIIGNIGSEKRTKYGAVGAEVNFTSRAESFTVGGQVLITESTYKKVNTIVKVNNIMEVQMKGVTGRVKFYDIYGMGEPFNLYLINKNETLIELRKFIDIMVYGLDDKVVKTDGVLAKITHLSESKAKIWISTKLTKLENIKLQIKNRLNCAFEGDIYAKVTSVSKNTDTYEIKIFFTSVSPNARKILKNAIEA